MAQTCPPFVLHPFTKNTPPPPHILRVPNEIIEAILQRASRVKRDDDRQFLGWGYPEHQHAQLKSIALTCRHFYALCMPYLWRDKEFILPREDDHTKNDSSVQLATDILSRQTMHLGQRRHFGSFVRSLCRDLTNGPHYDMNNSRLMAQLVCNLRSLRIDFHPKARADHYGLGFFAQSCPLLSEIYLENCRDTYDDFASLRQCRLTSLTLLCCTIKEQTLRDLVSLNKQSLRKVLLQRVLMEKEEHTQLKNVTTASIVPLIPIPHTAYDHLFNAQNLTHLALSDAICYPMLTTIVSGSPQLTKLAIIVKESDPVLSTRCIVLIAQLRRLCILSLAFRSVHPLSTDYERLACNAPSCAWSYFAQYMKNLRLLHVSASHLLLSPDFFATLINKSLTQIMLHHVTHVTPVAFDEWTDQQVLDAYRKELATANNTMEAWRMSEEWQGSFLTLGQAQAKGFRCFEEGDHVCFVKGFEDWCESET